MGLIKLKQIDAELTAARLGYIHGLQLEWKTVNTVDIGPGNLIDSTNSAVIENVGTLTADLSTAGVNGLDTGSRAISTWYHLHVIAGTSGIASLWSASKTAPTLPGGYSYFRWVGSFYNQSDDNLRSIVHIEGIGTNRWFYHAVPNASVALAHTVPGTGSWTALDLTPFCPPDCTLARFFVFVRNLKFPRAAIRFRKGGSTSTLGHAGMHAYGHHAEGDLIEVPLSSSQVLEYRMWKLFVRAVIYVNAYSLELSVV